MKKQNLITKENGYGMVGVEIHLSTMQLYVLAEFFQYIKATKSRGDISYPGNIDDFGALIIDSIIPLGVENLFKVDTETTNEC